MRDKDLKEVVLKLLTKEASLRLGCLRNGAHDVRAQRFFRAIDWDELRARRASAPWRPTVANALDTSNFDPYDEKDDIEPFRGADSWADDF